MVSIFLVIRRIKIPQCINAKVRQIHLLATHADSTGHCCLQRISDRPHILIPSQNGILNLLLPLLHLGIAHGVLFLAGQGLIALGGCSIVKLIDLVDHGVVFLQEALHHVIDAIGIRLGAQGHRAVGGLIVCRNGKSVDLKGIGAALKGCPIQFDLSILAVHLIGRIALNGYIKFALHLFLHFVCHKPQRRKCFRTVSAGCLKFEIRCFSGVLCTDKESLILLIKACVQACIFKMIQHIRNRTVCAKGDILRLTAYRKLKCTVIIDSEIGHFCQGVKIPLLARCRRHFAAGQVCGLRQILYLQLLHTVGSTLASDDAGNAAVGDLSGFLSVRTGKAHSAHIFALQIFKLAVQILPGILLHILLHLLFFYFGYLGLPGLHQLGDQALGVHSGYHTG